MLGPRPCGKSTQAHLTYTSQHSSRADTAGDPEGLTSLTRDHSSVGSREKSMKPGTLALVGSPGHQDPQCLHFPSVKKWSREMLRTQAFSPQEIGESYFPAEGILSLVPHLSGNTRWARPAFPKYGMRDAAEAPLTDHKGVHGLEMGAFPRLSRIWVKAIIFLRR